MKEILFATGNPGKLTEAQSIAERYGVKVNSPREVLSEKVDVDENGETFADNAKKKFLAYAKIMVRENVDMPLMADDGGIAIDALSGSPGVKSRRWKDGKTEMSDQELIDYCLLQLDGLPDKNRTAHFISAVAYGLPSEDPRIAEGRTTGSILNHPDMSAYEEGYPFRALFYMPEQEMMLHTLIQIPPDQRGGYISHRESSISTALKNLF
jgi:XTP/dITP diphosphohydrolase